MSLLSLCQDRALSRPNDPILHSVTKDGIETLTYGELHEKAIKITNVLNQKGFHDSHCLIALENPIDDFIAILGCLYAHVTPVILPYEEVSTTHNEILNACVMSQAKVILSKKKTGDIKNICWINEHKVLTTETDCDATVDDQPNQEIFLFTYDRRDKSSIIRLCLKDLCGNAGAILERLGMAPFQVGLTSFHEVYTHIGFMAGFILPFVADCPSWLLCPDELHHRPLSLLKLISIKKLGFSTINTVLLQDCLENITSEEMRELDLSCWQVALTTEMDIELSKIEAFKQHFFPAGLDPNIFYPTYGRKELGLCATGRIAATPTIKTYVSQHELCKGRAEVVPMTDEDARYLYSNGRALPGYEITLMRDGVETPCAPYEVGEVFIKSPYLAKGYYYNQELNERYFVERQGEPLTLKTGHLGFMNDSGELFITGLVEDICLISNKFIDIKAFLNTLLQNCKELNTQNFLLFKESKPGHQEKLIIMIETILGGNKLSSLYDTIIELACKDIELNFIFIAAFRPNTLPRSGEYLDRQQCQKEWQQGTLKPTSVWQLPVTTHAITQKRGFISLQGLSDKRKAEKLGEWLYSWLALKTGCQIEDIDAQKHLVYYGFAYVDAIQLAHELKLIFNQWVRPATIWEFTNLKALIRFLFSEAFLDDASPTPIPARNDENIPTQVTHREYSLYDMSTEHPDCTALLFFHSCDIKGRLDLNALNRALQTVSKKHDNLHMGYEYTARELKRVSYPDFAPLLEQLDVSMLPDEEQETTLRTMLHQLELEGFNGLSNPLWRVIIYKLSDDRHRLVLIYHSIIVDYWSSRVIFRDISQCYNAEVADYASKLSADTIRYAEFAHWQEKCLQNEDFMFQSFYWENRLDKVQPLYLPYDRLPKKDVSTLSSYLFCNFNAQLTTSLKDFAHRNEVELYTLFISAYQILLYWFTKEQNISIRCNQCNRHQKEFHYVVGHLEEHFILQEMLYPRSTAKDLLGLNHESLMRCCQNYDIPLAEVLAQLDKTLQMTMPNCAIDCHYYPQNFHFDHLQFRERNFDFLCPHMLDNTVHLQLSLFFNNETIDCRLHYRKALFNESTVKTLLTQYVKIITELLSDSHMPIQHLINEFYQKPALI